MQNAEEHLGQKLEQKLNVTLLSVPEEIETYVREVVAHVGMYSHRPQVEFRVSWIDSKNFELFAIPGGHIILSNSWKNVVQSESEFAGLLGHAIAHIAQEHLVGELIKKEAFQTQLKNKNPSEELLQEATSLLKNHGYSLEQIQEADRLGATYAMHFGYDVKALLHLLQRISQLPEKPALFNDMPQRIANLEKGMPELVVFDSHHFDPRADRYQEKMKAWKK